MSAVVNETQFATRAEAAELEKKLFDLGGGVAETFALDWPAGPFRVPQVPGKEYLFFRFDNGVVLNVGLLVVRFARYGDIIARLYTRVEMWYAPRDEDEE